MGKRIKLIVLFTLFILTGLQPIYASAQTVVNKALLVEQAKGKAPNVKVYMTGSDMTANATVSGVVSDIALSQNGEIKTFTQTGESIRYIILFDNSGSINQEQFEAAKQQLVQLRKNMQNMDEMQLYTVGALDVSNDKVDVLGRTAIATETDLVENDCKNIEAIEYINDISGKTILYRSLNEVLEEQSSQISMDNLRTIIILVTDGEDDSDDVNGKDNDKNATLENVRNSVIPVYGILLNNFSKTPNESKIKFTKNKILDSDNSHGYYYNCSDKTDAIVVEEAFGELELILREKTYVVNLLADTNRALMGKSTLDLTVNNQAIDSSLLDYSNYEQDDTAPVIEGEVKKDSKNSITFTLNDENSVNLTDAKDKTHYTIQTETEQKDGKIWTIAQVNVKQDADNPVITLTVSDEEFFNEKYSLIIDGIRDESQNQNMMENVTVSFTVEDGLDASKEAIKEFVLKYWWIGLIIIILVIGVIIIIIMTKKKSVNIVEMNPNELSKADSKLIRLTITDRSGAIKDVEWNIEGSLFVGRSDICNIFFDDDCLSKQHFVIEVTKMGCHIEDLESTNGTFVNGVKMTNRRLLLDGDVITAGREKFVFHVSKKQLSSDEEYSE